MMEYLTFEVVSLLIALLLGIQLGYVRGMNRAYDDMRENRRDEK
jgi:hypothetical protein